MIIVTISLKENTLYIDICIAVAICCLHYFKLVRFLQGGSCIKPCVVFSVINLPLPKNDKYIIS